MVKSMNFRLLFCGLAGVMLGTVGYPVQAQSARMTAKDVLNHVSYIRPSIEDGKVILPESPDDRYEIVIGGSSNEAVIDVQGNVTVPLEKMDVQLLYKIINKENPDDCAMSDNIDVTLTVPGKYKTEPKDNPRPEILPGIREWKGLKGEFRLTGNSRIVMNNPTLEETAGIIADYLEHFTGKRLQPVVGKPEKGDISLSLVERTDLGNEGYYMEIGDYVEIEANTAKGNLYGGTTLSQMISSSPDNNEAPKGYIRDYPAYEIRGCMLDVARIYIPLDYVSEMVRFMAYFKINEVQMHINDDSGEQSSCFRVESKRFPAINSGIKPSEVWSQDDYRSFQKEMLEYGVDIITEIDTPAHCRFVSLYNPEYMLDDGNIDLKNPEAIGFIKKIYDEFLDGDDPVFISRNFHIGADEYHRGTKYGDDFMNYLNEMIPYVKSKGLSPRMWASIGGGGMVSDIPVNNDVMANYWAYSWADFDRMVKNGFPCLNNSHDLYVVPGKLTGYDDYFNLDEKYYCWETTDLSGNWPLLSPAHPLLKGCQASIWYDRKVGTSQFDYFDRQKDQAVFISEKGWFGARQKGQTSEAFFDRVHAYIEDVPGVNPARIVQSNTETIASYDFSKIKGCKVKDMSGNGYDAVIDGLNVVTDELILTGRGSLELPFNTIGYPYTVSMNIYIDPATPEKAVIFNGADGTMYWNYDGKGHIGYERKGYSYILPYELPEGKRMELTFICDRTTLYLLVNGKRVVQGVYAEDPDRIPDSSTFVMPVESVCSGIRGTLYNLKFTNNIPEVF